MKVNGIDASYYYTQDLDRATAFYTWLIGRKPDVTTSNISREWTFPGGATFGLYRGQEFVRSDGVMFAVDDVPKALDEIRTHGTQVKYDGHVEETPVCFMGFAEDSEGNGIILHKRK